MAAKDPIQLTGKTVKGVQQNGVATLFTVSNNDHTSVELAYIEWLNGETDVRAQQVESPCKALRGLERGRLRMSISPYSAQQTWIELSQARIQCDSPEQWSNLFKATKTELDDGAGIDVFAQLQRAGAQASGCKEVILKDTGKRKITSVLSFQSTTACCPLWHSWRQEFYRSIALLSFREQTSRISAPVGIVISNSQPE